MNTSPEYIQYCQDVKDFLHLKHADASNTNVKGYLDYQLALATLALRAAKGQPLLAQGDSFPAAAVSEAISLARERHGDAFLRMF